MSDVMERVVECMCCPECHCKEYVNKNLLGNGFRQCKQCGQEWWTDINYGKIDVHTKPLKAKIEQLESQLTAAQGEVEKQKGRADRAINEHAKTLLQIGADKEALTEFMDRMEQLESQLSRCQAGVWVEGDYLNKDGFQWFIDLDDPIPTAKSGQRVEVIVLAKEGE